ncbi:MAG TPA: type IV toxin-antitoxin system AbiEi family antitoxin domain-containing protein [Solirubrobacterales bacterium]
MDPRETANEADNRQLARFRERERAIAVLADDQHGVVARDQLIRLGFEEGAIARRLRVGRLHEVQRGVYAPGRRLVAREGRWTAAVLASGLLDDEPEAIAADLRALLAV